MNAMYPGQFPAQSVHMGQAVEAGDAQSPMYSNQSLGTAYPPQNSLTGGWFAVTDPGYVKGFVLGAGLAYLLTNPKVQRALVKGAVSIWTSVQGGFEEVKEQIQDIKCEMSVQHDEPESTQK